jgi:cobalt/nickel transport system permease protein
LASEGIPAWLVARERYEPRSDRGRFIEKSLKSVLGALAALHDRPGAGRMRERLRPELKLASLILIVLLASLSRSALFLEAAAAFEFGCLCLLRGELIARVLRRVAGAGAFAVAILLPALFWGRGAGVPILCAKLLLAMLAAALFSATTSWPSIATAFAGLRVPDVFVMTLDMTIKYIGLLGGLVLDMLRALKLRSVGRNEGKTGSLAAVAGTVFLKSKEAAQEQYQAMECRCFSGKYRITRRRGFGWPDASFAIVNAALVLLFFVTGAPR